MKSYKWIIAVIVLALGLWALFNTSQLGWRMGNPLVGMPAPNFTLTTLNGQQVTMDELRNGQSAIIFFWATWCPHCRRELKQLDFQAKALSMEGIKIILVDVEESPEQVKRYLGDSGISLEVLMDQDGQVSEEYALFGLPTFFFVNQAGIVTGSEHALPENYQKLF